ncbi:hypothetical protein K9U39_17975 [Rhodoblastus acidophilus]|uniref:Uncharacterized protein n=1 Tax=Candidatus Rhodoblastus alkanivorans TaxID=2954117 RepID=A0ABS9Z3X0_9HYPH|nr:hypothetical protein [Candidatus Rhodoblastus alkanivorans]MCI4680603.1 hypothetical protein [Candidatus Rhodoblastus alkanivorans]MCI4681751.1 hypothetical protein [Candidatus Rhodoblastus alkanivorans]MDI4642800.1 hypothetical protein [Rhodoblastus acidophilus]
MSDPAQDKKPDRPALPRDAFRAQRAAADTTAAPPVKPVIVTPDYDDRPISPTPAPLRKDGRAQNLEPPARAGRSKADSGRNPFDAYGERSSSRPYALRLPDPIDLVIRQMAAEERTQPLRIVDRILYEHLKKAGRLPPTRGA